MQKNQILSVTYPNWNVPSNVKAFTTTVNGGVSIGDYTGLNLGNHVGDSLSDVEENRQRLQNYIGQDIQLCWLNQIHSDIIIDLLNYQNVIDADASVTSQKNRACLVMTADCLPVLLCNQSGTKVAALHCGWKGVYQNLIGKMLEQHFSDEVVIAWLGPAIAQSSYEVDEKLYQHFIQLSPQYQSAFLANRVGHYLFDLTNIAKQQLQNSGVAVENIFAGNFDTFSDHNYYSYRRNAKTGRMATLIYLQDN